MNAEVIVYQCVINAWLFECVIHYKSDFFINVHFPLIDIMNKYARTNTHFTYCCYYILKIIVCDILSKLYLSTCGNNVRDLIHIETVYHETFCHFMSIETNNKLFS